MFRLKPDITSLDTIRKASQPTDVADELSWTWCYHDPTTQQTLERSDRIDEYKNSPAGILLAEYPGVASRLETFDGRPNWVAVVNIKSLGSFSEGLLRAVDHLRFRSVRDVMRRRQRP